MELLWYLIICTVLIVFFVLDGYDFGTGIIHLFLAKSESDKKTIAKAAGLFWDSNEVWLVAAGGMLFMAFPTFYASAFSGFYLPLMIVLWLIVFRAIGLELRDQFDYQMWKDIWDKAFGIASLLLALFFGIAFGNLIRGVNLGGVHEGIASYEPHYFFLPLWNSRFSPTSTDPGVIDWFTLLVGVTVVLAIAIHGGNWVILKTSSSINNKLKRIIYRMNMGLMAVTLLLAVFWSQVSPDPFDNFLKYPFLFVLPLIHLTGMAGLLMKNSNDQLNFWFSTMIIVGGISTGIGSLFPALLPSTNEVSESLTIYNTTTTDYGLSVAFAWAVVGFALLGIYIVVQKKLLSGKIDDMEYGH